MTPEEISEVAETKYNQFCVGSPVDTYGNIRPSWKNLPSSMKNFYCRLVLSFVPEPSQPEPPKEDE